MTDSHQSFERNLRSWDHRVVIASNSPRDCAEHHGAKIFFLRRKYPDANDLAGLRHNNTKPSRHFAVLGVVTTEDDNALRLQMRPCTPVRPHTLHEVVLLRNRGDDVSTDTSPRDSPEKLIDPLLTRTKRENSFQIFRFTLQQYVRGQLSRPLEPTHGVPPAGIELNFRISICRGPTVFLGCSNNSECEFTGRVVNKANDEKMTDRLGWNHPAKHTLRKLAVDVKIRDTVVEFYTLVNYVVKFATQINLKQRAKVGALSLMELTP